MATVLLLTNTLQRCKLLCPSQRLTDVTPYGANSGRVLYIVSKGGSPAVGMSLPTTPWRHVYVTTDRSLQTTAKLSLVVQQ